MARTSWLPRWLFQGVLAALIAFGAMSVGAEANAQYTGTASAWRWTDISTTGTALTLGNNGASTMPLPFDIPYWGRPVNTVTITSEGYLILGINNPAFSGPTAIPDANSPNGIVAPLWASLDPSRAGASVRHQLVGTFPSRQFIVQWTNVPYDGTNSFNTFQAVIHEGTGYIELRVLQGSGGRTHITGIENEAGNNGLMLANGQSPISQRAWVLQGPVSLANPDCGADNHYDCFRTTAEFDSVLDEINLAPDYYVELDFPYEWVDIPAGQRNDVTAQFNATVEFASESTGAITLPFPITLYETVHNSLYISDQGLVSFSAPFNAASNGGTAYYPSIFPNNAIQPNALVAPAWSFWAPEYCGRVYYGTVGTAPNRRFVVSWDNICHINNFAYGDINGTNLLKATFQAVFYEGVNEIRFNYRQLANLSNFFYHRSAYNTANGYYTLYDTSVGIEDHAALRGSNILGADPNLTFSNNYDYSQRLVYRSRSNGSGAKILPTPFQVDPACQDAVATVDSARGMFPFSYYGAPETSSVYVSSNGLLGFNNAEMGSYQPTGLPSALGPDAIVAPGWTDLLPCGGGEAAYTFRGITGGRSMVAQWTGIPQELKDDSNGNGVYDNADDVYWFPNRLTSSQAILRERSEVVQINIASIELEPPGPFLSRVLDIGIENGAGNQGISPLSLSNQGPHTIPAYTFMFVPHCDNAAVTLGTACNMPAGGVGVCSTQGVWSCVAGDAVCLPAGIPQNEICDNADNDCDGIADEGVGNIWYLDSDGDGYGDLDISVGSCTQPPGFVTNSTDCDDTNNAIHPNAPELCDGIDNNCVNGTNDEIRQTLYRDLDGDGFGAGAAMQLCPGAPNVSSNNTDCNDANAAINPNATEVCDGLDNDCNLVVDDSLSDVGQACIDAGNITCGPGVTYCVGGVLLCQAPTRTAEVCDGYDNDCDGDVDEGDDALPAHSDPNIVLYASFDDDTGAQVRDLAGQPDHGTHTGATHVPGVYLDALRLTSSQRVSFQDGSNGELDFEGVDKLSISTWINPSGIFTADHALVSRQNQFRVSFVPFNNTTIRPRFTISYNNGLPSQSVTVPIGIPLNTWTHFGLVYDGLTVSYYVNGVLANVSNPADGAFGALPVARPPMTLGLASNGGLGFIGSVDDLILWKTALPPATMLALARGRSGAPSYAPAAGVLCSTSGAGVCGTGRTVCDAASGYTMVCEGATPATQEFCDGLDNDCDGSVDEGNNPSETAWGAQGGGSCLTGLQGACRPGRFACAAGGLTCQPNAMASAETCDAIDNDCDGATDETWPEQNQACNTGLGGICGSGTRVCVQTGVNTVALQCQGPVPGNNDELCNGVDDDCDGAIDEGGVAAGLPSGSALDRACGCGGSQSCNAGSWGVCSARLPQPELCDGFDNDCDGTTDEELARRCTTQCGEGIELCQAGFWGSCTAPDPDPELCDGRDNDCDGDFDEGVNCGCRLYASGGPAQARPQWTWVPSATNPQHTPFSVPVGIPLIAPMYDTNTSGQINVTDTPNIILMTADQNDQTRGILRILRGLDGTLRSTLGMKPLAAQATPAIADVNNDGRPEVAALVHPDGLGGLALMVTDGTILWHNTTVNSPTLPTSRGGVAIGNVDTSSTTAEIAGCHWLVSATGTTLWNHDEPQSPYCSPVLADLNGDGDLEVILGGIAYNPDGSVFWLSNTFKAANGGFADGLSAVADLDNDGDLEVIVVARDVYVLNGQTGAVLASTSLPGGGRGGAPHIADLNLNGYTEIVVAGSTRLSALRYSDNGTVRTLTTSWSYPIQNASSGVAAATSIDLNNDGQREVLFADELSFYIFDSGGALIQDIDAWGTRYSHTPTVADIDADDQAEIIILTNKFGGFFDDYVDGNHAGNTPDRVIALEGDGITFPLTGRLWNQHSYHITNITDDLRAPITEPRFWEDNDTHVFRGQHLLNASSADALDLTISVLDFDQGSGIAADACAALNRLTVEICNIGALDLPAVGSELTVQLTVSPQPSTGPWNYTVVVPTPLPHTSPNNCQVMELEFTTPFSDGPYTLQATVDPPAGSGMIPECREDNNVASRPFVSFVAPGPEVCDGIDNDCDGLVDTNPAGMPLSRSCDTGCAGTQACVNGSYGACNAPTATPEVCDGKDNNCDGIIDNQNTACEGREGVTCVCTAPNNCGCVETLEVNNCGAGCPLGSFCGTSGECVPGCVDDFGCPTGSRCGDDGVCFEDASVLASGEESATADPNAEQGCSTGPLSSNGAGVSLLALIGAVFGMGIALRRR